MQITTDIRIRCEDDSCIVTKNSTGSIHIGSVMIKPVELADFLKSLNEAVEIVIAQPLAPAPKP